MRRTWTRIQLFCVSLAFLLMMVTVNLLNFILTRFSIHSTTLKNMRSTLYGFVGDVKLYQDWYVRNDNYLGAIGEKSRVAIRRRMVNALVRTAKAVRSQKSAEKLDGYYIFAHSLGTVVAFNGLMELGGILPRYLTEADWVNLDPYFKDTDPNQKLPDTNPKLPPWIDASDKINRSALFEGLRGFLTMGSPLDKFAALWPVIVLCNAEPLPTIASRDVNDPLPKPVPWINVADKQDIVGGSLDLLPGMTTNVGGLELRNIMWADRITPFTAHTSYWKVGKRDRLIDGVIMWLEGRGLPPPDNFFWPKLAPLFFWFWVGVAGSLVLGLIGTLPWIPAMWTAASKAHGACAGLAGCMAAMLESIADIMASDAYHRSLAMSTKGVLAFGVITILVCSVLRHLWEQYRLGDWERNGQGNKPPTKPVSTPSVPQSQVS